jgi:UDP-N-acetyl-D-galactosamine dehydrogenase
MTVQGMIRQGGCNKGDTVVVLGLTFKEDCADLRNSKVADLVANLKAFDLNVVVHDPIADAAEAKHEYGIHLTPWDQLPKHVSAVVAAVSHREYLHMPLENILALLKPAGVFTDIKSAFAPLAIQQAGHYLWRL